MTFGMFFPSHLCVVFDDHLHGMVGRDTFLYIQAHLSKSRVQVYGFSLETRSALLCHVVGFPNRVFFFPSLR
jgi:hypothetical protein